MSTATYTPESSSSSGSSSHGSVTDRVKGMAHHAAEGIQDAGSSVKHAAADKLEHLREASGHYAQVGREKAVEVSHQVEDYVRKEPVKAMAAAGAIGFLMGMLLLPRD